MKKIVKLAFFLSFLIMAITRSENTMAQSKSVQQVADAVEKLRKAMIAADGKTLNELASDSLSYGHSSGVLQNKTQFVESFTSGASVFVSITLTDQTIKVVGSTAIVRHTLSAETNDKGKGPGTVKLGILLVWTKVKGDWVLLARQAVKVQ